MRLLPLFTLVVLGTAVSTTIAVGPTAPGSSSLLSSAERTSTARMTRLRSVRIWWDERNRVKGLSLKGEDANDRVIALAGNLPKLESLVLVAYPENALTDSGLAPLAKLPNLQLLSISGDRISDAGLLHLAGQLNLRTLVLNGNFTDRAVETISSLPNLTHLDLTQARISDAGMDHVANLTNLNTLILNGTHITNRGIEKIAQMKNLKRLYLDGAPIDDAAVRHLTQLNALELLLIRDTLITPNGIRELLPQFYNDCRIIHQTGTYKCSGSDRIPDNRDVARTSPPPSTSTWRAAR